jgi:GntR family transcriptional regulator
VSTVGGKADGRSVVDRTEEALRNWITPGRYRPGDRLPGEHELAGTLKVSRGSLRGALSRLEDDGTILRRRGSGTVVAKVRSPTGFRAGLEVLESYKLLARRQKIRLTSELVEVGLVPAREDVADSLSIAVGEPVLSVSRTLFADDEPAAWMEDTVHPDVSPQSQATLERRLRAGSMVLDVLRSAGVPVAYARTGISATLVRPRERVAVALGLTSPTAVLELTESMVTSAGETVQYSINLFAPGQLELHVMRALAPDDPAAIGDRGA